MILLFTVSNKFIERSGGLIYTEVPNIIYRTAVDSNIINNYYHRRSTATTSHDYITFYKYPQLAAQFATDFGLVRLKHP